MPSPTDVPLGAEQSVEMPEVPVQNVSVSSTEAETSIRLAVEAATTPVSTAVV